MRRTYKPILALLGTILVIYFATGLQDRLRMIAGRTLNFPPYYVGVLTLSLLVGGLVVLLVAYLWSRPREHRPAAWVFLIAGLGLFCYPILRAFGGLPLLFPGRFFASWMERFFPGSAGSLSAAMIAAAGLLHLLRYRDEKPPRMGRFG